VTKLMTAHPAATISVFAAQGHAALVERIAAAHARLTTDIAAAFIADLDRFKHTNGDRRTRRHRARSRTLIAAATRKLAGLGAIMRMAVARDALGIARTPALRFILTDRLADLAA